MFGLKTLDVGIGMALMFLFVSLICSAMREFGESLLKTRASSLSRGVKEMLGHAANPDGATAMAERVYDHPLIASLFNGPYDRARPEGWRKYVPWLGRNGLPSYIPADSFARVILQIARSEAGYDAHPDVTVARLRTWITAAPDTALKQALRTALDTANNDLARTEKAVAQWYDSAMERVSGWYTRRTQYWLFYLGLASAVVMNIDAITVMKTLSTDEKLRDQVVSTAGQMIAACEQDRSQCPQDTPTESPVPAAALPGGATDTPADDATLSQAETNIDGNPGEKGEDAANGGAGTALATTPASEIAPEHRGTLDDIKHATAKMRDVDWPMGWNDSWRPAPQYRSYLATHSGAKVPTGFWSGLVSLVAWLFSQPLVLVGWLVTAFGVTFGASFWFDLLNKFMVVRSTVKPDEKSPKEPSKS